MVNGPENDRKAAYVLDDENMKLPNLSHDLLDNFLPSMLGKIYRVSFGLLSKQDLKKTLESGQNVSLMRQLAAIPYVGKDIPSHASQFSHPDVVIGLTVLAYWCDGLRFSDFENVLLELRERLDSEYGRYHKRPSALRYVQWVECAGGKLRGPREGEIGNNDDPDDEGSNEW